jgi:hypothetical protein
MSPSFIKSLITAAEHPGFNELHAGLPKPCLCCDGLKLFIRILVRLFGEGECHPQANHFSVDILPARLAYAIAPSKYIRFTDQMASHITSAAQGFERAKRDIVTTPSTTADRAYLRSLQAVDAQSITRCCSIVMTSGSMAWAGPVNVSP